MTGLECQPTNLSNKMESANQWDVQQLPWYLNGESGFQNSNLPRTKF